MDFLQAALIFLILLLSVFLTLTGIQVFFILKDLKKALDKLNEVLPNKVLPMEEVTPATSSIITSLKKLVKRDEPPQPSGRLKSRRFYKKVL